MVTMLQGEDIVLELAIFDKLTNTAVNLTSATNIITNLTTAKVVQGKFSLSTQVGYGSITIKEGVGNEHILQVQIKRENSKTFAVGYMQANVLVELPDAILTEKRDEYTFASVILVKEGLTKDEIV